MPLPSGYTLDQPEPTQSASVSLPAGYKLDSPSANQPEHPSFWHEIYQQSGIPGLIEGIKSHPVQTVAHALGSALSVLNPGLTPVPDASGHVSLSEPTQGQQAEDIANRGPTAVGAAFTLGALPAVGLKGVSAAARAIDEAIPQAGRAAKNFAAVKSAAGDIPIDVSLPGDAALRIQDLANSGGSMPKVVRDFLKRVTDPEKNAITYSEARDFYSNASRLSADEAQRLTPAMKRQVGEFTRRLGDSIGNAADQVGQLENYQNAMSEYHNAMRMKALKKTVGDIAKKAAITGAVGATGYKIAKELGQ